MSSSTAVMLHSEVVKDVIGFQRFPAYPTISLRGCEKTSLWALGPCHLLWVPRSDRGRPARNGLLKAERAGRTRSAHAFAKWYDFAIAGTRIVKYSSPSFRIVLSQTLQLYRRRFVFGDSRLSFREDLGEAVLWPSFADRRKAN